MKWFNRILAVFTILISVGMIAWLFILLITDEDGLILFSMLYLGVFISLIVMLSGIMLFCKTLTKDKKDE